ncbi:MAG: hypothetical protein AAF570_05795, partial [Bacteroidota bacterium]
EVKKLASDGQVQFSALEQAFKNLTDEGGRFSGLTEKLATSASGAFSTLSGNISKAFRAIGDLFLPAVKDAVSWLNNLFGSTEDVTAAYHEQISALRMTQTRLEVMVERLQDTTLSARDQKTIVEEIRDIYPEFAKGVDLIKASEEDLKKALDSANVSINRQIELLTIQAAQAKAAERFNAAIADRAESLVRLTDFFGTLTDQEKEIRNMEGGVTDLTRQFGFFAETLRNNGIEATSSMDDQVQILRKSIEKFKVVFNGDDIGGFIPQIEALADAYEDSNGEILFFNKTLEKIRDTARKAGFSMDELSGNKGGESKGGAKGAKKAVKGLREEIAELRKAFLSNPVEQTTTGLAELIRRAEDLDELMEERLIPGTKAYVAAQKELRDIQKELASAVTATTGIELALDSNSLPQRDIDSIELPAIKADLEGEKMDELLGLDPESIDSMLGGARSLFGTLKSLNRDNAQAAKRLAIIEATINTAVAFTKALTAGGPLALINAGLIAAAGVAQVAEIRAQNFAQGGMVTGGVPGRDSVPAMLMPGERVMRVDTVQRYGPLLEAMHENRLRMFPQIGRGVSVNLPAFEDGRIVGAIEKQNRIAVKTANAIENLGRSLHGGDHFGRTSTRY